MDYQFFCGQLCNALFTPLSNIVHTNKQDEIFYVISAIIRLYCPCIVLTQHITNDAFPLHNSSIDCISAVDTHHLYASMSPYSSCHNNALIKKGSHIYLLTLSSTTHYTWAFITFIPDTFISALWVTNNTLYACTNTYGLIRISLTYTNTYGLIRISLTYTNQNNTHGSMYIIDESCKGPMTPGIYQTDEYLYLFGYNHHTKQFGCYYTHTTELPLDELTFVSMQNNIQSLNILDALKSCYYIRYWKQHNCIILPWNAGHGSEMHFGVDAIIILALNDLDNSNDSDSDRNSDTDNSGNSDYEEHDDDNACLFKVKHIQWLSIQTIDSCGTTFSIEISAKDHRLLYCSSRNGIASIQLNESPLTPFECKKQRQYDISKAHEVQLDFLFIPTEEKDSFYVSTDVSDDLLAATTADSLYLFHFV
eukprot:1087733_1